MFRRLAKKILQLSPELHFLIMVAFLVSLAANLFVAFYTNGPPRKVETFFASMMMMIAAGFYLPVAIKANRLWQDAQTRSGMEIEKIVVQLVELERERENIEKATYQIRWAIVFFLAGIVLMFFLTPRS